MTSKLEPTSSVEQQDAKVKERIFFTENIWHEVYPKVNPGHFLRALREHIDLTKYGPGVNEFYYAFVALDDDLMEFFLHWVNSTYRKKKAVVDIGVRLPYEEVVEASKEEAFKADVEAIFEDPDWWVEL